MTTDHLPPGLAIAWEGRPAGRRGPKPALTVHGIVAEAIELADTGGYAAISLPRIAARLGVTTTALYRYVANRDELLVLLLEVGWGPPPASLRRRRGWRSAARAWTLALIDRLDTHPWLIEVPVRGAPLTPNLLAWLEAFLAGMRGSGLGPRELLGCAVVLDGYARSTARLRQDVAASGAADDDPVALGRFLLPRLAGAGLTSVAELMSSGQYATHAVDAEWGLTRILDGIAALVAAGSPSRT
jgi:AcrR family transcriptional regulator